MVNNIFLLPLLFLLLRRYIYYISLYIRVEPDDDLIVNNVVRLYVIICNIGISGMCVCVYINLLSR